jgi:hypothetical protein
MRPQARRDEDLVLPADNHSFDVLEDGSLALATLGPVPIVLMLIAPIARALPAYRPSRVHSMGACPFRRAGGRPAE